MKEHLLDKRVVTRALQEGLLDKEVYQRMLDELPDLSHKVQTAAESQALEAANLVAPPLTEEELASAEYDDDDDDDDEDDDDGDEGGAVDAAPTANVAPVAGDTLEMERPRIPGSYTPNDG